MADVTEARGHGCVCGSSRAEDDESAARAQVTNDEDDGDDQLSSSYPLKGIDNCRPTTPLMPTFSFVAESRAARATKQSPFAWAPCFFVSSGAHSSYP